MQFGVSECLAHWGLYRRSAPAVVYNGHTTTYGELDRLVSGLALEITERKRHCERIGVASSCKFHALVAMNAVVRSGRAAVLFNTGLSTEALKTNFEDTGIDALLYAPSDIWIAELFDPEVGDRTLNIAETLQASQHVPIGHQWWERGPVDEWGVFFSSGTTGTPKAIERSHYSIVTELLGWVLELGLSRSSVFYVGRPIFYTGGAVLALSVMISGGVSILNDYRNMLDFSESWADYQNELKHGDITWAFFVPDQLRRFVQLARDSREPYLSAANILVMGAPICGAEKLQVRSILRSEIIESWGNTESLGTITDPEDVLRRGNSIGRPFLGDYLCVVDGEGNTLPAETLGYLAGGLEAGFEQYSNRPAETNHAKRFDLIVSEDLGYVDADGYFYIRGRAQDSFVFNGQTFFLTELEDECRKSHDVIDCCLTLESDTPDELTFGALVVVNASISHEAVALSVRETLRAVFCERAALKSLRLTDSIPRLASGKVDRSYAVRVLRGRESYEE